MTLKAMENYKIIRNGDERQFKYDFTLKNGLNLLVKFRADHATEQGFPTHVEVFDHERNNVTDEVLQSFLSKHQRDHILNQDDVHQFIAHCQKIQKEQIRSWLGFPQRRPLA